VAFGSNSKKSKIELMQIKNGKDLSFKNQLIDLKLSGGISHIDWSDNS